MFELIYSSVAVTALNDEELELLLGRSRHHNEINGITGLLLHVHTESTGSAYFVQLLEGGQAEVERTYERIANDELHSDLQVLSSGPSSGRTFGDWTMRLEETSAGRLQPVGAGDQRRNTAEVVRDPETMGRLIRHYQERPEPGRQA